MVHHTAAPPDPRRKDFDRRPQHGGRGGKRRLSPSPNRRYSTPPPPPPPSKRSRNRGPNDSVKKMSFKEFVQELEDDIDPSEAKRRFQEYKSEYDTVTTQKRAYFNAHKDEAWLKDRYQPTNIDAASADMLDPYVRKVSGEKFGWKYGCGAKDCRNRFHANAVEPVYKHLKLKHPELVLELTSKLREHLYFQNYMNDPFAPSYESSRMKMRSGRLKGGKSSMISVPRIAYGGSAAPFTSDMSSPRQTRNRDESPKSGADTLYTCEVVRFDFPSSTENQKRPAQETIIGKKSAVKKSAVHCSNSPRPAHAFEQNPKRKRKRRWTQLEEDTLRAGVHEHGVGNWKDIKGSYPEIFEYRTGVNLKDKWRNLLKKKGGVTCECPQCT